MGIGGSCINVCKAFWLSVLEYTRLESIDFRIAGQSFKVSIHRDNLYRALVRHFDERGNLEVQLNREWV